MPRFHASTDPLTQADELGSKIRVALLRRWLATIRTPAFLGTPFCIGWVPLSGLVRKRKDPPWILSVRKPSALLYGPFYLHTTPARWGLLHRAVFASLIGAPWRVEVWMLAPPGAITP